MDDAAVDLRSALTYATHDGVALQGDLYHLDPVRKL